MSSQAAVPSGTPPTRSDRFPSGIPFIVGNEGAERFSFYGMRQILYVYLASLFIGFAAEKSIDPGQVQSANVLATQVTHLFIAGVYAFPMIGAILADRLLGKYKVILYVSLIYCAGHVALALAGRAGAMGNLSLATGGVYLGLTLIAIGSGGIKPCVSANVGDQFTAENGHMVSTVFQIFYFIINFGSFFSTLITPWLLKQYSAEVAFLVPGVLMFLATVVFWLGRNKFVKVPPQPGGKLGFLDLIAAILFFTPLAMVGYLQEPIKAWLGPDKAWTAIGIVSIVALIAGFLLFGARQTKKQDDGFLAMLIYSLTHQKERTAGEGFFSPVRKKFGEEAAEGVPAVLKILLVFSMVSFFWGLWDQNSSTWVEQAKHMDLTLIFPTWLFRWTMTAVPLLALYGGIWLFSWLANKPLRKQATFAVLGLIGAWLVTAIVLQIAKAGTTTIELAPAQIGSINPLLIMIIIPLLTGLVYRPAEKRGKPIKPLVRMSIGMFIASIAFVAVAVIQHYIDAGAKPSILWQIVPYFILTVSEALVSITGLEFAYTQAPRRMKSTIQGFWLLCVSLGDLMVVFLAPLEKKGYFQFFLIFAALMAGAAVVFSIVSYFYKGKTYLQDAQPAH